MRQRRLAVDFVCFVEQQDENGLGDIVGQMFVTVNPSPRNTMNEIEMPADQLPGRQTIAPGRPGM